MSGVFPRNISMPKVELCFSSPWAVLPNSLSRNFSGSLFLAFEYPPVSDDGIASPSAALPRNDATHSILQAFICIQYLRQKCPSLVTIGLNRRLRYSIFSAEEASTIVDSGNNSRNGSPTLLVNLRLRISTGLGIVEALIIPSPGREATQIQPGRLFYHVWVLRDRLLSQCHST